MNMDDTSDLSAESCRKIHKSESRLDVGRIRSASTDLLLEPPKEWKLVLCHVPGDIQLSDILEFFEDGNIELKGIMRNAKCGKRLVVEVTFTGPSEMEKATKTLNYKKLKGHPVDLKTPDEALIEMADMEYYWSFLPLNLKDEVLSHFAFSCEDKPLTRVSRFWRESLGRTRRQFPGTHIENSKQEHFYSCPFSEAGGQIDEQITHLVLCSPPTLPDFGSVREYNEQMAVKQLTVFQSDDLKVASMNYGKPSRRFMQVYKNIRTVTFFDSFLHFEINVDSAKRWVLAVLVPKWRLTIPKRSEQEVATRNTLFIREVVSLVESFDRWWPNPIKQLEWLQESFAKISGTQRQGITAYLECAERTAYRDCIKEAKLLATSVMFEKHELNKMDCAFIGHYITPTKHQLQFQRAKKESKIGPPPCRWMNCSFMTSSKDGFHNGWDMELEEVRQKGSSQ